MSKKLTKNEVVALARLARLKLSDNEIAKYKEDINSILDYIKVLDSVDTTGLKPTMQVTGLENVMRSDIVEEQLATPDQLMAGTPSSKDGYIKVGRMI